MNRKKQKNNTQDRNVVRENVNKVIENYEK